MSMAATMPNRRGATCCCSIPLDCLQGKGHGSWLSGTVLTCGGHELATPHSAHLVPLENQWIQVGPGSVYG